MDARTTISLDDEVEGGCACGGVRYRIAPGPVPESGYCHCRTCQRQSGAPVVAWFAIEPGRVAVEGAPKFWRASARARREFCGDCGTYLFFREDDPAATLSVNTATLDDPALVPPAFHIWCESRIAWFETDDDAPRHQRGRA